MGSIMKTVTKRESGGFITTVSKPLADWVDTNFRCSKYTTQEPFWNCDISMDDFIGKRKGGYFSMDDFCKTIRFHTKGSWSKHHRSWTFLNRMEVGGKRYSTGIIRKEIFASKDDQRAFRKTTGFDRYTGYVSGSVKKSAELGHYNVMQRLDARVMVK